MKSGPVTSKHYNRYVMLLVLFTGATIKNENLIATDCGGGGGRRLQHGGRLGLGVTGRMTVWGPGSGRCEEGQAGRPRNSLLFIGTFLGHGITYTGTGGGGGGTRTDTIDGNYPIFTMVVVIYHCVKRTWIILVTPQFLYSI